MGAAAAARCVELQVDVGWNRRRKRAGRIAMKLLLIRKLQAGDALLCRCVVLLYFLVLLLRLLLVVSALLGLLLLIVLLLLRQPTLRRPTTSCSSSSALGSSSSSSFDLLLRCNFLLYKQGL